MSHCDDVRAHLPLFVGGDLEQPQARAVREHLGLDALEGARRGEGREPGCASCRALLASLQRSREALLELPARSPAPAVSVWTPVQAALRAEGLVPAAPVPRRLGRPVGAARPRWGGRRLAAAAAVLVAVGGLYVVLRPGGDLGPGPLQAPGEDGGARLGLIAEQHGSALDGLVVPASDGRLRPLHPDEVPLGERALPLVDGMRAWGSGQPWPGYPGASVDPSRPTFASDRAQRR